jgi:hypothetical protein
MPYETMLTNRRSASQRLLSRRTEDHIYSVHELREDTRHDVGKRTPSAATPTQDSMERAWEYGRRKSRRWQTDDEHRDAYRRDSEQDSVKKSVHETREATRHDAGISKKKVEKPNFVTPTQNSGKYRTSLSKPHDTSIANRRQASRRLLSQSCDAKRAFQIQPRWTSGPVQHDAGKTTPSVATPIKDTKYSVQQPREATRYDTGKPTLSAETTIVATLTQDSGKKRAWTKGSHTTR